MKTDLNALLKTVSNAAETLAEDRAALPADQPSTLNQQQLLGHTISGLRGIASNLRGLLGEEVAEVGRKKPEAKPKPTKPEKESAPPAS
jgi:hypothetical protein